MDHAPPPKPDDDSHDDHVAKPGDTPSGVADDPWMAALAAMAPGPRLAVALTRVDLAALSTHDLVVVMKARARQKASMDAQLVRMFAELTNRPEYHRCTCPPAVVHTHRAVEPAGDEVSLAMAWTPSRGKHHVAVALELTSDLTATLAALSEGHIDYEKAMLIAERTRCLPMPVLRREVAAAVLPGADRKTRGQLDYQLRRQVIAVDPQGAEARRRQATAERRVTRPEPAGVGGDDGMARMELMGPAGDLVALWTAVDAAARRARTNGDARTLEQLRFDTLTGLGWTALSLGHLGCCRSECAGDPVADAVGSRLARRHGRAATVNVTVAVSTLFGADEQPGWLAGFGPITADASRRISGEGPWRRVLTDPRDRRVVEYGRTTYAPPAELADHVAVRDVTCRFPTCARPANESEIDHVRPYGMGRWHRRVEHVELAFRAPSRQDPPRLRHRRRARRNDLVGDAVRSHLPRRP